MGPFRIYYMDGSACGKDKANLPLGFARYLHAIIHGKFMLIINPLLAKLFWTRWQPGIFFLFLCEKNLVNIRYTAHVSNKK